MGLNSRPGIIFPGFFPGIFRIHHGFPHPNGKREAKMEIRRGNSIRNFLSRFPNVFAVLMFILFHHPTIFTYFSRFSDRLS